MTNFVQYYSSSDLNAPILSGTVGSLITVLNQCLIDGYSTVSLTSPFDTSFSNVTLLLHGDGTNGSTAFTDSSSLGQTVTGNGSAQISTAQSKWSGASIYFNGSSYLSVTGNPGLTFDSGDY